MFKDKKDKNFKSFKFNSCVSFNGTVGFTNLIII